MKEQTKLYRKEYEKDIKAVHAHNNSKIKNRTVEENEQAYADKQKHLALKWEEMKAKADTDAQKHYCNTMLTLIKRMPKWYAH